MKTKFASALLLIAALAFVIGCGQGKFPLAVTDPPAVTVPAPTATTASDNSGAPVLPSTPIATLPTRANQSSTPNARRAPNNPSFARVEKDVAYCTADGVALKMDIYYSRDDGSKPTSAVLYVHGGGRRSGDKGSGAGMLDIRELQTRGFLVAAVNYRLAPQYKWPAMIEDVKCAVRYLRANAAKHNIDPNHIGAYGGSAGGHLVSTLGTADASAGFDVGQYLDQSSRVQAVVDMFGPSDFTVNQTGDARSLEDVFGATATNPAEIARSASPVTYVTQDDPPFLILQGDKDELVKPIQSQILYDRLQATGVPATLVMVKNAGHGFTPVGGRISPSRVDLTKMMADFFEKNLKK